MQRFEGRLPMKHHASIFKMLDPSVEQHFIARPFEKRPSSHRSVFPRRAVVISGMLVRRAGPDVSAKEQTHVMQRCIWPVCPNPWTKQRFPRSVSSGRHPRLPVSCGVDVRIVTLRAVIDRPGLEYPPGERDLVGRRHAKGRRLLEECGYFRFVVETVRDNGIFHRPR